jgi:hypothetical protein
VQLHAGPTPSIPCRRPRRRALARTAEQRRRELWRQQYGQWWAGLGQRRVLGWATVLDPANAAAAQRAFPQTGMTRRTEARRQIMFEHLARDRRAPQRLANQFGNGASRRGRSRQTRPLVKPGEPPRLRPLRPTRARYCGGARSGAKQDDHTQDDESNQRYLRISSPCDTEWVKGTRSKARAQPSAQRSAHCSAAWTWPEPRWGMPVRLLAGTSRAYRTG